MTDARIGYGSKFGIEGNTPGTYVDVAEVVSIQFPGWMRDAVEATHMQSPDGYKEFIPGLKEMSDAQITVNWIPSATDALLAAFNDETGGYQITAPNGVMMRFAGFVTNYTPPQAASGDKLEATVTFKVTGKATLHAAV